MALSDYLNLILTAVISSSVTITIAYFTFRIKLESRLKDLEHEIKSLEPLKNLLYQVGIEQTEKVFKGEK
jgi:hypothetical protein